MDWFREFRARRRYNRWLRYQARQNDAANRAALKQLAEDIRPYGYKIADWIMKPPPIPPDFK